MEEKNMTSFFTSEVWQFSKCARLKIEQKQTVDLDFTYLAHVPGVVHDVNPYESFRSCLYWAFIRLHINSSLVGCKKWYTKTILKI